MGPGEQVEQHGKHLRRSEPAIQSLRMKMLRCNSSSGIAQPHGIIRAQSQEAARETVGR
jgi:hypothetical protein